MVLSFFFCNNSSGVSVSVKKIISLVCLVRMEDFFFFGLGGNATLNIAER